MLFYTDKVSVYVSVIEIIAYPNLFLRSTNPALPFNKIWLIYWKY